MMVISVPLETTSHVPCRAVKETLFQARCARPPFLLRRPPRLAPLTREPTSCSGECPGAPSGPQAFSSKCLLRSEGPDQDRGGG